MSTVFSSRLYLPKLFFAREKSNECIHIKFLLSLSLPVPHNITLASNNRSSGYSDAPTSTFVVVVTGPLSERLYYGTTRHNKTSRTAFGDQLVIPDNRVYCSTLRSFFPSFVLALCSPVVRSVLPTHDILKAPWPRSTSPGPVFSPRRPRARDRQGCAMVSMD